ncbi:hypothetical protein ASE61_14895 [Bosea sp. Root670]|nr:hypothetical protein ASE61_14895 [Bosea sp. Root670]
MPGLRPVARAVERPTIAPGLHRIEGLRVDDREMRRRLLLVLARLVDAGDAPAGRRVLHHPDPIPDHAACIERIEQDTVAAIAIAIDGDSSPEPAARRRHGLVIELAGYLAWAAAGEIFSEDPAHGLGLFRHNLQLPRLPGDSAIAIGTPACTTAVPDHASEAAPHFLRQSLQEERGHRAFEADMHFADLAIRDGDELHARELRGFIEPGDIGEVARKPVEILGQDGVILAGKREADQALIIRPAVDRGAGGGAIGEDVGDGEAEAVSMRAAQCDLVLDRAVTLQVG